VQTLGAVFTTAIVLATLWMLGAVDWAGELVNIEYDWLDSPIGIGV